MPKKTIEHYPSSYGCILEDTCEEGRFVVDCDDEKHARSLRATFNAYQNAVRETRLRVSSNQEEKAADKNWNSRLLFLQGLVNRVMVKLVVNNTTKEYKVVFEDKLTHGHVRAVTKAYIKAGKEDRLPDESVFIIDEIKEELRKEGWQG